MAEAPPKRLQKSRTQRIMFGVTGGVAEYLNADVVLVRVAFVLLAVANGIGILAYIALAIFMPEGAPSASSPGTASAAQPPPSPASDTTHRGRYVVGLILIALGVIFLLQQFGFFWWPGWGTLWPVVLIAIGLALVVGKLRK